MNEIDNKYALTSWGQPVLTDLECPTGQLCQVRAPGMQAMIAGGVLESADTLTNLVDQKHIKRVQGRQAAAAKKAAQEPDIDTNSLLKDPDNMNRVFSVVDRVTEYMVVQPNVRRPIRQVPHPDRPGELVDMPLAPEDREDGVIYTDMIDLMDKMYIFQYAVGGDTNLEQFRNKFTEGVGSVATQ